MLFFSKLKTKTLQELTPLFFLISMQVEFLLHREQANFLKLA